MNAGEILAEVDHRNPNDVQQYQKAAWMLRLEKLIVDDVLLTHELTDAEIAKANAIHEMREMPDAYEPVAQPPYEGVYLHYIDAQIAMLNVDTDAYENAQTLYNNEYLTFQNAFNRTHRFAARVRGWKF